MTRTADRLDDVARALRELQHETDLIKHVLIVKEPGSQLAADAFEGLRRQIVAAAAERRSHLVQIATMATAVSRATSVADLEPLVRGWMDQAGVGTVWNSDPAEVHLLFDDLDGGSLAGAEAIDVVEPAYVDTVRNQVIRTGRARRARPGGQAAAPASFPPPPGAGAASGGHEPGHGPAAPGPPPSHRPTGHDVTRHQA